jgi:hypothetical protein
MPSRRTFYQGFVRALGRASSLVRLTAAAQLAENIDVRAVEAGVVLFNEGTRVLAVPSHRAAPFMVIARGAGEPGADFYIVVNGSFECEAPIARVVASQD